MIVLRNTRESESFPKKLSISNVIAISNFIQFSLIHRKEKSMLRYQVEKDKIFLVEEIHSRSTSKHKTFNNPAIIAMLCSTLLIIAAGCILYHGSSAFRQKMLNFVRLKESAVNASNDHKNRIIKKSKSFL